MRAQNGYDLSSIARFDITALADKSKRNRRKQVQMLGGLKRFAASHSDVEFHVRVAGSLDAMNNFRKRYTRYLKRMAKMEAMETVARLRGPRTPHWSGQTKRSSGYMLNYNGSQRFHIEFEQGAPRRGYHYIGPLHDTGSNVTGRKFWFLKAMNAYGENTQDHVDPSPAVLAGLL